MTQPSEHDVAKMLLHGTPFSVGDRVEVTFTCDYYASGERGTIVLATDSDAYITFDPQYVNKHRYPFNGRPNCANAITQFLTHCWD